MAQTSPGLPLFLLLAVDRVCDATRFGGLHATDAERDNAVAHVAQAIWAGCGESECVLRQFQASAPGQALLQNMAAVHLNARLASVTAILPSAPLPPSYPSETPEQADHGSPVESLSSDPPATSSTEAPSSTSPCPSPSTSRSTSVQPEAQGCPIAASHTTPPLLAAGSSDVISNRPIDAAPSLQQEPSSLPIDGLSTNVSRASAKGASKAILAHKQTTHSVPQSYAARNDAAIWPSLVAKAGSPPDSSILLDAGSSSSTATDESMESLAAAQKLGGAVAGAPGDPEYDIGLVVFRDSPPAGGEYEDDYDSEDGEEWNDRYLYSTDSKAKPRAVEQLCRDMEATFAEWLVEHPELLWRKGKLADVRAFYADATSANRPIHEWKLQRFLRESRSFLSLIPLVPKASVLVVVGTAGLTDNLINWLCLLEEASDELIIVFAYTGRGVFMLAKPDFEVAIKERLTGQVQQGNEASEDARLIVADLVKQYLGRQKLSEGTTEIRSATLPVRRGHRDFLLLDQPLSASSPSVQGPSSRMSARTPTLSVPHAAGAAMRAKVTRQDAQTRYEQLSAAFGLPVSVSKQVSRPKSISSGGRPRKDLKHATSKASAASIKPAASTSPIAAFAPSPTESANASPSTRTPSVDAGTTSSRQATTSSSSVSSLVTARVAKTQPGVSSATAPNGNSSPWGAKKQEQDPDKIVVHHSFSAAATSLPKTIQPLAASSSSPASRDLSQLRFGRRQLSAEERATSEKEAEERQRAKERRKRKRSSEDDATSLGSSKRKYTRSTPCGELLYDRQPGDPSSICEHTALTPQAMVRHKIALPHYIICCFANADGYRSTEARDRALQRDPRAILGPDMCDASFRTIAFRTQAAYQDHLWQYHGQWACPFAYCDVVNYAAGGTQTLLPGQKDGVAHHTHPASTPLFADVGYVAAPGDSRPLTAEEIKCRVKKREETVRQHAKRRERQAARKAEQGAASTTQSDEELEEDLETSDASSSSGEEGADD